MNVLMMMTDIGLLSVRNEDFHHVRYLNIGGCVCTNGYLRVNSDATYIHREVAGVQEYPADDDGALVVVVERCMWFFPRGYPGLGNRSVSYPYKTK